MTKLAAAFSLLVVAACFPAEPPSKPTVVASFLPLYCFTANVAADRAHVEPLLTGAISPHDYQFSPHDMRRLSNADLLVTLGLGFEPWVARVRGNIDAPIVEAATGMGGRLIEGGCGHEHDHAADHEHEPSMPNAHVWLDPQLAIICVSNVAAALTSIDPSNRAAYDANAKAYAARLRSLDEQFARALRPFAGAAVLAYHDAVPYFARRYGLSVAAVVQPVPEVNPSLRRVAELRQVVRRENVKALLVDANARSALAERISKEFRIPLVRFDTLETGKPSPEAYEKAMQTNVDELVRALK